MKHSIIGEVQRGFLLFSAIYTVTTIASSALQLTQGQPADTNFHILNRAAIVLIATITILLFTRIRLGNQFLSYLVPYLLSLGLVFVYVWLTGFIEPLHPDAYRDIFLNFTAVAVCIMAILFIKDRWQSHQPF